MNEENNQKKYQWIESLYKGLLPFWSVVDKKTIYPIDFNVAWWKIIFRFKWSFSIIIVLRLIISSLNVLFPILVAWAISNGEFKNYLLVLMTLVLDLILSNIVEYYYSISLGFIMASVNNSTNEFFLSVDPEFHSTRSSGKIISKATRGVISYGSIMDFIVYNLLTIIAGFLSVVGALLYQSVLLGVVGGIFLTIIIVVGVSIYSVVINQISKYRIEEEDKLKELTVENLQEVSLIRSTFATEIQIDKVRKQSRELIRNQINSWILAEGFFQISWVLYIISLSVVGYLVFDLLEKGALEVVTAVAILAVYSNGASKLLYIGRQVGYFVSEIKNVQDLFEFIRNFGKQTYPVLSTDDLKKYE